MIIGAAHGGERSCATGTTMYVSHAPPMLAIAVHPGSRTTRFIPGSGEFSVSLLHDSQQALASAAVAPEQQGALLRYRRRYMRSGRWTSEESPERYPT